MVGPGADARMPDDVMATGTGVGVGVTPPRWLRAGDFERIAFEGIGEFSNRFVEETT